MELRGFKRLDDIFAVGLKLKGLSIEPLAKLPRCKVAESFFITRWRSVHRIGSSLALSARHWLSRACFAGIFLTGVHGLSAPWAADSLSDLLRLAQSSRMSASALITTTPNMRCVITLLAPLTLTVHPPWLSLRLEFTRSALLRAL